jgi:hypothetical protein
VIGDLHGQDLKLKALLSVLGYRVRAGAYRHPAGRIAVFVGDLIDRGPGQREVTGIVRRMEAAGSARVVMGNHELNAIGYATRAEDGVSWLRKHSAKNEAQHRAFLDQVGWGSPLHRELLAWFRTLPVALDLGGIRVCHAWWDNKLIAAAAAASNSAGQLNEDYLRASFCQGEAANEVLGGVTKGLEVALPDGSSFVDHSGAHRKQIRVRWWDADASTFRQAALVPDSQRHRVPDDGLPPGTPPGNPSPVPVFVGHYWLTGEPGPQNINTAVLDYGAGLDGPLVAYRWEGEPNLDQRNFVAVGGGGL